MIVSPSATNAANTSDADGSTIVNTATIGSSTTDPNSANNSSSVTSTVSAVADLAVAKSDPATATGATAHLDVVAALFQDDSIGTGAGT